jgi:hypothetical protein
MKLSKDFIMILGGVGAILTGYIAILTYLNSKETKRILKQNALLDQELKTYELEIKKSKFKD